MIFKGIEVKIEDLGIRNKLVKIYYHGRVYAAAYGEPFPDEKSVLTDYLADANSFLPYDESSGKYLSQNLAYTH